MKRTPMQELIEEMEKSPLMYANAIELAETMLEKEKEVIMYAYWHGGNDVLINPKIPEEYYNKTFKTKEI